MARPKNKDASEPFEQSLQKLEAIVRRLEEDEISLEDALKAYEEGLRLQRACEAKLREADNRVRKLSETPDGQIDEEAFEPESEPDDDADEEPSSQGDAE